MAVKIRNAPKTYISQLKRCSSAAPAKMKMPRMTSAPSTPQKSTRR